MAPAGHNRRSVSLESEADTTRKAGNQTVAVKLRLMRMGKTKQPTYRVVAADSRSPRDGRFIEILGVYAPRGRSTSNPDAVVEINNDKALKWLRQGALPTDRVERLLKQSGAWEEFNAGKAGGSPVAAASGGAPVASAK